MFQPRYLECVDVVVKYYALVIDQVFLGLQHGRELARSRHGPTDLQFNNRATGTWQSNRLSSRHLLMYYIIGHGRISGS